MKALEIVGELPNDQLIVEVVDDGRPFVRILQVAHDYIGFIGTSMLSTRIGAGIPPLKNKHATCANAIFHAARITVPIDTFGGFVLPRLNEAGELKPEHYTNYNKRGDSSAVKYYDNEKKCTMVAFRMPRSQSYDTVTLQCYEALVKSGALDYKNAKD